MIIVTGQLLVTRDYAVQNIENVGVTESRDTVTPLHMTDMQKHSHQRQSGSNHTLRTDFP